MVDKTALQSDIAPSDRIIHEWKRERKVPLLLEIMLFIIVDLIVFLTSILTILGYTHVLGIYLGKPSLTTYLSIPLWAFVNYGYFSNIMNKTIVEVSAEALLIRITPLPWPGRTYIPTSEIRKFRVVENSESFGRRVLSKDYRVHAQLKNGNEVPIIYNIWTETKADDYLGRIERATGIIQ